jgi:VanZ family protein
MMVFIFAMSAMSGGESSRLSDGFVKAVALVVPPFDVLVGAEREGALTLLAFFVRKAAHFTEFAVLGGFAAATAYSAKIGWLKGFFLALAVGCLYSVSDEAHQYFISDRTAAAFDVGVDSAGVLFGAAVAILCARATQKG